MEGVKRSKKTVRVLCDEVAKRNLQFLNSNFEILISNFVCFQVFEKRNGGSEKVVRELLKFRANIISRLKPFLG